MKPKPIKKKSFSLLKTILLLGITLGIFSAIQLGYAGYGWAHLRSLINPKDEQILDFIPGSSKVILVIDPHLIAQSSLKNETARSFRTLFEPLRIDIQKATSIDIFFDIDKCVLSGNLLVAKGRFEQGKIFEALKLSGFEISKNQGYSYMHREHQESVLIDDSYLLFGDESSIFNAEISKKSKQNLKNNQTMLQRLDKVGWGHPVMGAGFFPSGLVNGENGAERSFCFFGDIQESFLFQGRMEMEDEASATRLKQSLEEKRDLAAKLPISVFDPSGGKALTDLLSTVKMSTESHDLLVKVEVSATVTEEFVKRVETMKSWSEMMKRLVEE